MNLYFYNDYQEDGCAFCGDDGERYGLVAAFTCDIKLPTGNITAAQLKTLIEKLTFDKEKLELYLDKYPNANIEITE